MQTLFDEATRSTVLARIDRMQSGTAARWGKMNAEQMLAHLVQSLQMSSGELPTKSKRLPIRFFPLKQLIVYLLPFPKGAPTARELIPGANPGTVEENKRKLAQKITAFGALANATSWPEHPAFGRLSARAWGVLTYRHVDHHLRQFGV
ncbi:MAG: DUF1569 domain-containing protein [Acidobacteria bacterium]|nr:DUF1569 domain-containing protein [Acidobacteriota bacterium]MBV9478084.1 DUF1569 domain-containing protein [Acidobacteriota bacterium]